MLKAIAVKRASEHQEQPLGRAVLQHDERHLRRRVIALADGREVLVDLPETVVLAAGDNPARMHSEAAFAHLCGVAPIHASSGQHQRHRLDRGGDRQANRALWCIAGQRARRDPNTIAYIQRRTTQDHKTTRVSRVK